MATAAGPAGRTREDPMKRTLLFLTGVGAGAAAIVAAAWIGWPESLMPAPPSAVTASKAASAATPAHDGPERVALSEVQIRDAGITLSKTSGGMLKRHFLAPGSLVPDADHIARVSVRVLATVAELNKRLGDGVEKGEVVAAIESREIADAKSEYLAARLT